MRKSILAIIASVVLLGNVSPAMASPQPPQVYYAGTEGTVRTALDLAELVWVSDLSVADVIVLNNAIPDPDATAARVRAGAGLVLILGPDILPEQLTPLLGAMPGLDLRSEAISLEVDAANATGIAEDVLWSGAPQIRERIALSGVQLVPLVMAYGSEETLLGQTVLGEGTIYVFTPLLDDVNPQIQE